MKHTTHSEQELEKKIREICEHLYKIGLNDGGGNIKYSPKPTNYYIDQLMQLIQSEREKVLEDYKKSRCIHGFCYCSPCVQCIAKLAQKEESK